MLPIIIDELKEQKRVLLEYLISKLAIEDYHAIRDACTDIEIIDAKIKLLKELNA